MPQESRISEKHFFAKGKRGIIETGILDGKKVAIKTKLPESKAVGRIENEGFWLRALNRKGIGPGLIDANPERMVYGFVEGKFIMDFIRCSEKGDIVKVLEDVLDQCFLMDEMGISKEEMHRPLKHIIVTKENKPVLIDFERVHEAAKPHNVTQLCQFMMSISGELEKKGIRIERDVLISAGRRYADSRDKKDFDQVKAILRSQL